MPMGRLQQTFRVLGLLILAAAVAAPALAYTIVLKDGETIQAQEKYEIRNGRAFFTLTNGTETFIDADQIDVAKTERANQGGDLGATGILIDEGTAAQPPPTRTEDDRRSSLADLIRRGTAGPGSRPEAARPSTPARPREPEAEGTPRTTAGFVDLTAVPRRPLDDAQLATALRNQFLNQGIEEVQVFQGTAGSRPLVEVTTAAESTVLRAMVVGANALLQLREQFPDRLRELELLMVTPSGGRGGQFQMDPEMASQLMGRQLTPDDFFVRYVQF